MGSKLQQINNNNVIDIFNSAKDFKNEKEFCDFLERNIENVCKDVFNDEYISHERESFIHPVRRISSKGCSKTRIDFLITCKKGNYLVECKNPSNSQRELNRCLSQVLDYIVVCENFNVAYKSAWILSTKYHNSVHQIIQRFDLPINLCIMNKTQSAILECKNG